VAARVAQRMVAEVAPQVLEHSPDLANADQIAEHDSALHMIEDEIAFARASADRCAGATAAQLNSIIPEALRAAQLGDLKAADCYVGSMYQMMPGLLVHPEWLTEFKQNAPQLFEQGVRNGDWVAVELLHHAYAGVFPDTPAGQTIAPDIAMDYRYLRLERLGAHGEFADKVDRELAEAKEMLTPAQIGAGDAWAQDALARFFHNGSSDEVSNGANICQQTDD
jgi:hypothetical protein